VILRAQKVALIRVDLVMMVVRPKLVKVDGHRDLKCS
jgi:hypothetical protein